MRSTRTLSEFSSKELIAEYGVAVPKESLASTSVEAVEEANKIGYPVVLKLCGEGIAHKTERSLVRLHLKGPEEVQVAARDLLSKATKDDGDVSVLVAQMVEGRRELIAGIVRDPNFGPCVMLGLGGILTEAIGDAVFARLPLKETQALTLVDGLRASHIVTSSFRGEPAVDRTALANVLLGLSRLAFDHPEIISVDLNPLIINGDQPIAVDALVEQGDTEPDNDVEVNERPDRNTVDRLRPLFHPKGIIVAGVSSHPGKFGFVAYHNLRRFGYSGNLYAINRDGAEVLGTPTLTSVSQVPRGAADLIFVCTPNESNVELLRASAARGVKAAFVASGGYAETGLEGRRRQDELVKTAEGLGMVVAGPNGQGVISTPVTMCAQIVAPYPPEGSISVASQSGNLVSSYLNYSVSTGVGVSKAIAAGNSAQLALPDYLEYFADDPETSVGLTYLEGVGDGASLFKAAERMTSKKPLVLLKGGAEAAGARAAASHTGSLASDDRIFDGICRQLGIVRAQTVEFAFEYAATFATQPLPKGRRTVIFTTAGGWGVLAADACTRANLDLIQLPQDLKTDISKLVPPRWSQANPIDLAGGETRDTISEVMDLVCGHPGIDAVIYLGIGIQSGQANAFASGEFFPEYGLDRIVEFHTRQDRRYAEAASDAAKRYQKPVLTASELVHTDREYGNAGPEGVRDTGFLCYSSAHRAIDCLRVLCEYAEYRDKI
ncbi:acetate--CoA ligase family protein [Myxococcota bacterium]|nr:acetate--CoA ligase family protein [Myxococcota bacterium]